MPIAEDPWNFEALFDWSSRDLLYELARVQGELAHLAQEIALSRIAESKENPAVKNQRLQDEGREKALTEKKFFIIRLLELPRGTAN